jgi:hypothetical protein
MSDETVHEDNDTPDAEGSGALNADTPNAPEGAAVDDQGAGQSPTESEPDETADPKGSGRPV